MQDKDGRLQLGLQGEAGEAVFDVTLQVKAGKSEELVLLGSFAHGPPGGRFLYLAWAEENGTLAQRLKIPLGGINWNDVRDSIEQQKPVVGLLVDHHPRVTSTGANIGGSRPVSWRVL
ncbi:hypothetical protein GTP58_20210 [Duganella sp. CY15W]|uniref:DUF5990 family protein n=1 Tax=Duganella sp. CY15W TaxID=2692172 RepID=UPI00136E6577|nr:DUF5990 family protein [Duganella sp. CY15W]MYM30660.1 hypothetical protein [Duganella sp. CY15W]